MSVYDEDKKPKPKIKPIFKILIAIVALFVVVGIGFALYCNDYYHADETAEAVLSGNASVKVEHVKNYLTFGDETAETGYVFYPGGKVAPEAYAPLMQQIAQTNTFCVIVEMPCNLAVFGSNSALDVVSTFDNVSRWYIGGHSLGGAMATSCAAKNPDAFRGVILMGAYPTEQLPDNQSVLSFYGSEDTVLNWDKFVAGQALMPPDYTEICIEGGNHAQYGNYGIQEGDGIATITREQQQQQVTTKIRQWIGYTGPLVASLLAS